MVRRRRSKEQVRGPAVAPALAAANALAPASSGRAARTSGTAGFFRVDSAAEAENLALHLLDPARQTPVVLVTSAAGQPAPYLDMAALAGNLGGLAELWEMPTGSISWAFTRQLPPLCDVYGGAARVYPPGLEWADNPYVAPLRFVYGPQDGPTAIERLTTDALRAVRAGGSFGAPAPSSVAVEGTVLGFTAGRGMVELTRGASGLASVWTELVARGVDAECVLTRGMALRGTLDPDTRRLDLAPMMVSPADALAGYAVGSVVLGVTRSVERALCIVEIFPDFPVSIEPDGVVVTSRTVDLRALISEGEVVATRVLARGELPEDWQLSLVDVGPDDVPLKPPSILSGGPSWLVAPSDDEDALGSVGAHPMDARQAAPPVVLPAAPPRAESVEPPVSRPAESAPRTPPASSPTSLPDAVSGPDEAVQADAAALASLAIERDAFVQALQREREGARRAKDELAKLRTAVRKETRLSESLRQQLNAAEAELGRSANDEALFTDPLEQLRFEVELAWARRVPAEQKAELKLKRWVVGPDFFTSWAGVAGVARSKVVDVVVEVLIGRVHELDAREVHQLRSGMGGDDPPVTRGDGATCWRASLQVKTASARRLHYWLLNDGSVELSSIRLHDDMRP